MAELTCIETYLDREKNHYGAFIIEPFDMGQGITVANALRRVLMSDITGAAITGVRINNIRHQYESIDSVREDTVEILLNLKEIVFKAIPFSSPLLAENRKLNLKAVLNLKGPKVITAGLFLLPKNKLSIVNPHQYICTLVKDEPLFLELDVEIGSGYQMVDETQVFSTVTPFESPSKTLSVDRFFGPIKNVNYKIKLIHDTDGNLKESVFFEVVTNGSLTPKRAIFESLKFLLKLFYQLLITPEFLDASEKWHHYLKWKTKTKGKNILKKLNQKKQVLEKKEKNEVSKQKQTVKAKINSLKTEKIINSPVPKKKHKPLNSTKKEDSKQ